VALAVNFALPVNLNYRSLDAIRPVHLQGGETIAVPEGTASSWVLVGQSSSVFLLLFLVDATRTAWRSGDRRRAAVVGGSAIACVILAAGHFALVNHGILRSPFLISVAYLGIVAAMAWRRSAPGASPSRRNSTSTSRTGTRSARASRRNPSNPDRGRVSASKAAVVSGPPLFLSAAILPRGALPAGGAPMKKVFGVLFGVVLVTSLAIGAVIFYTDLRAPRGLTVGALYVLPILVSLLADNRKLTLSLAILFSVLVAVGYASSKDIGVPSWIVMSDRIITVMTIWIAAVLGLEMTTAKRRIREMGRLMTICMWTKQVRVEGEWVPIERYLTDYLGVKLTHGISQEAAERILREEGLEGR
jgi:hypothetical protein